MEAWLKGGLWGLGVGIVLQGYNIIRSFISIFDGPYINNYYLITHIILRSLFLGSLLLGFFLAGALIGWLNKNWEKITGKSKKE